MTAATVVERQARRCPTWCRRHPGAESENLGHYGSPQSTCADRESTATTYTVALHSARDAVADRTGEERDVWVALGVTGWELAGADNPCDHLLSRTQAVELIAALQSVLDEGDREGWAWATTPQRQ